MEFIFLIIVGLIILGVLNEYAESKTSSEIMLLGIEITIVGVAFIVFGDINSSNGDGIFSLIGLLIVLGGFAASIFGFVKN
ncbi:hypothetical protein [Clostridium sp. ZS2-4]|uniref:hypothetical protein n=1 Tax=Clostridium sp. ZS2-4 TaxID=2987703 RepID=UPI00227D2690|nr:hypothetical protein [Clostridium sp. ZS2-4]MCY6356053.1 hypothetical protein [Clostridium sp. ZS2-4]